MTTIRRNGMNQDSEKWAATQDRARAKAIAKRASASVEVTTRGRKVIARRTPIKAVSAKRARENRERRAMLEEMFPEPENVMCVVPGCCDGADDAHEPMTRGRGGSITDPDNVVPICRQHHAEVTFKPESELGWAYELGILRHGWDRKTHSPRNQKEQQQ